jgi:hypothetical protein
MTLVPAMYQHVVHVKGRAYQLLLLAFTPQFSKLSVPTPLSGKFVGQIGQIDPRKYHYGRTDHNGLKRSRQVVLRHQAVAAAAEIETAKRQRGKI